MDLLTRKLRQNHNVTLEKCIRSYIDAVDEEVTQTALLVVFTKMDKQLVTTKLLEKNIKLLKEETKHSFDCQLKIRMLEHLLAYNKK